MKWLIVAVGLALVAVFVIHERNAVKTSYVNGLAEYNSLPGREYILQKDVYLFKLADRDTSYPLIGSRQTVPQLPPTVSDEMIGKTVNGVRFLGIARVGDRLRIASIRREESRRGTEITFELLFSDEASHKYSRVDAFYLLDHSPEANGQAPRMLESYAAERVKG